MRAKDILLSATVLGLAAGYAWSAMPPAAAGPTAGASNAEPMVKAVDHGALYPNCRAAWNAGHAPIFAGQPGYRIELDGDEDGIACEPIRSN